jgi:NTE family protein
MNRIALVLAGCAARGAYEVGVVLHLLEDVARELGHDIPVDILSGTSVGSINASFLAAFADDAKGRAARLARRWTSLEMRQMVDLDPRGVLEAARGLFGAAKLAKETDQRRGGVLSPKGIERVVHGAIP